LAPSGFPGSEFDITGSHEAYIVNRPGRQDRCEVVVPKTFSNSQGDTIELCFKQEAAFLPLP
jgi:hypothetical protein